MSNFILTERLLELPVFNNDGEVIAGNGPKHLCARYKVKGRTALQ